MTLLLIRADAGTGIGAGHFMRCLALAEAWRDRGGRALFLSAAPSDGLVERARSRGVDVLPLQAERGTPADLEETLTTLRCEAGTDGAALCLDGYVFGPDYMRGARAASHPLMVVDDVADRPAYHADLLLNQNLGAEHCAYVADADTELLLGPRYALLRSEFAAAEPDHAPSPELARRVLVTLGGGDPQNVTSMVIQALSGAGVSGIEATVVVGGANPHRAKLERVVAEASAAGVAIRLVQDVDGMPALMRRVDLAISAAGSTCWELCRLGVPALLLVIADNQRGIAAALDGAGAAESLGRADEIDASHVGEAVAALARDAQRRDRMSDVGRGLVDGQGAARVASFLLAQTAVGQCVRGARFRSAARRDAEALLRLANDPVVRENSFSTDPIEMSSHVEWLDRKLGSPDTRIWVIEAGDDLAAQIRFDRDDKGVGEIGFAVAAPYRGRGLGSILLEVGSDLACEELRITGARGIVHERNPASGRAFIKAGFIEAEAREMHGRPCRVFEKWWSGATVQG